MRLAPGAGLTAVLVLLGARSTIAHDPITTKVTFAREIRAILSTRCTPCHAPGGSAPMPLTTYEQVRPWARSIKEQVLTRRMPKWHAARGFGAFRNDPTLTPIEMALIVSWVDGGLPRNAPGAGAETPVAAAARRKIGLPVLTVPPGASGAAAPARRRWISGWSFEPGDPLITSATISSDAGVFGTWIAGDPQVSLPGGSGMRVSGRLHVDLRRREPADYEQPFTPKPSVLSVWPLPRPPARSAWTEQVACGAARAGPPAELIAVRPIVADGGSARIWLERIGAPRTVIGWFREFESRFARTYWLARTADLPVEARLQADVPCAIEITLISARR
jgi:hypothetical protein